MTRNESIIKPLKLVGFSTMRPLHTGQNGHHKQINKQQVLERMRRKGNPSVLLVGMHLVQPLWKIVWNFLKKTKNGTAFLPWNSTTGIIYPKNLVTPIQKNLCTPMFIAAQFTISKCPIVNEWTKKLWYIYTMEHYAAERKKEGQLW